MIDLKEVVAKHVQPTEAVNIEEAEAAYKLAQENLHDCLTCETELREAYRRELYAAENRLCAAKNKSNYARIDLSFLRWRKKQREFHLDHVGGFFTWMFKYARPVFGAFRINCNGFTLRASSWQHRVYVNSGDDKMDEYFSDLISHLRADFDYEWKLKGAMPKETRENINRAQTIFGNDIYIIQELTDQPLVTKADPLVIGIKNGIAHLIDVYDATPVEQYIASEFSHG